MSVNKCWKAIKTGKRNFTFVNKKNNEMVYLLDTIDGFMTNVKGDYKIFQNRKEAKKFTDKYMKKHDKC